MSTNKMLEQFYKENFDSLCRKISRRAGSPENAEDVVQEAFYRALKYWSSFNGKSSEEVMPWFMTIMHRSLRDFKAIERNQGVSMDEPADDELTEAMEETWIQKEHLKYVQGEIDKATDSVGKALKLYFFNKFKPKEISQILDIPVGTVYQRIQRFKDQMATGVYDEGSSI